MSSSQDPENCTAIDPNPLGVCALDNAPYKYIPVLWVNALFLALFTSCAVGHVILSFWPHRFARGGYMLLAATCAAGELGGYAARVNSHTYFFHSDPHIAQLVTLVISPVFISAANYVTLERIQIAVGTELARLSSRWYISIFVVGDVVSLLIQAAGGGISATADTDDSISNGSHISLAGVVIQVFVTVPFLILLLDFVHQHYRQYKQGGEAARDTQARWTKGAKLVALASIISTVLVLIRCIYRIVEMAQGWDGWVRSAFPSSMRADVD